jgi:hypothetical protein
VLALGREFDDLSRVGVAHRHAGGQHLLLLAEHTEAVLRGPDRLRELAMGDLEASHGGPTLLRVLQGCGPIHLL